MMLSAQLAAIDHGVHVEEILTAVHCAVFIHGAQRVCAGPLASPGMFRDASTLQLCLAHLAHLTDRQAHASEQHSEKMIG